MKFRGEIIWKEKSNDSDDSNVEKSHKSACVSLML